MPIRSSGKRKQNQSVSLTASQQREALRLYRISGLSIEAIGERYGVGIESLHALVEREL